MAAGALEAQAQKHLADVGGDVLRFGELGDVIEIGRRVEIQLARSRQQLGRQLVVRLVLHDGFAEPAIHQPAPFGPLVEQAHAKQVAEPRRPDLGKLGPIDQLVDQLWSRLCGSFDSRNARALLERRQEADGVEIDAPQELGIGAQGRGNDVHPLELGENQLVDEVVAGNFGVVRCSRLFDHRNRARPPPCPACGP